MARRRRAPARRRPTRRRTARSAARVQTRVSGRRARRTATGLAKSDEGKILIATLAMQILSMVLTNLTKTLKIKWLPPQFIVPSLIYFLARQRIIPIEGLKTVAFTMLANSFWRLLGIDYAGYYAGNAQPNYPRQFDYQNWPRSPQQTAQALIAAQQKQFGHDYQGGQQILQTGRQLAARGYQGQSQQILQTGRSLAARRYRGYYQNK